MKRLLILTALALVTASTAGCWRWFNRGAQCDPCTPATSTYADPCLGAPSVGEQAYPGPMTTTVVPQ